MSRRNNVGTLMDTYQKMHIASGAGDPGVTPTNQSARVTLGGPPITLALDFASGEEKFTINGRWMKNDLRELLYLLTTAGVEVFPSRAERGRFLEARRKRIEQEAGNGRPTEWTDIDPDQIPTEW